MGLATGDPGDDCPAVVDATFISHGLPTRDSRYPSPVMQISATPPVASASRALARSCTGSAAAPWSESTRELGQDSETLRANNSVNTKRLSFERGSVGFLLKAPSKSIPCNLKFDEMHIKI